MNVSPFNIHFFNIIHRKLKVIQCLKFRQKSLLVMFFLCVCLCAWTLIDAITQEQRVVERVFWCKIIQHQFPIKLDPC